MNGIRLCNDGSRPNPAGSTSEVTQHAHKMAAVCDQELKALEKELEQLEAEINPVLDDNAVVALCYLLGKSIDVMKSIDQVLIGMSCDSPAYSSGNGLWKYLSCAIYSLGRSTTLSLPRRSLTTTRLLKAPWTCRL